MKRIKFTKMQGAGNDFVVFDRKINENLQLSPELVSRLCDRHFGVGANGVLVIDDVDDADFRVEYYEADGTTGNLCANGSRCMIRYAASAGRLTDSRARFIFNAKQYSGEVIDDQLVKFNLNPPVTEKYNFTVEAAGHRAKASYINNGTPHLIIMIDDLLQDSADKGSGYTDIDNFPFLKIAKELREYTAFDPAGTNVNFYSVKNDVVFIRTFERGVEGETLACGTGVAAAAIVVNKINNLMPPVKFITKGGDLLSVHFSVANQMVKDLSLIGKAETVFTGELLI